MDITGKEIFGLFIICIVLTFVCCFLDTHLPDCNTKSLNYKTESKNYETTSKDKDDKIESDDEEDSFMDNESPANPKYKVSQPLNNVGGPPIW